MDLVHGHFFKTLVAIIAVIIAGVVIESILLKRITSKRKMTRAKIISRNVLVSVLLLFLIKIWVDGFIQILALLGFVSAALTITQKENILNLTGGLIIMWRNAFFEGDYISIIGYTGIIKNIGIFYFTLAEVVPGTFNEFTLKEIKIPNSTISLHPFKILQFDNFVLVDKTFYYSFKSNLPKLEDFKIGLITSCNDFIRDLNSKMSHEEKREYEKLVQRKTFKPFEATLGIEQGEHKGFKLHIFGHCPGAWEHSFYQFIEQKVIEQTKYKFLFLCE